VRSRLTELQRDLLEAFFAREDRFFLTGGAALAGFYLGHRTTNDLDLFVSTDLLDEGEAALRSAASDLGATLDRTRTSPTFRRWLVRRADEGVVVDLVRETGSEEAPKRRFGAIRVDPPEEILANKLCTLLSRAERRDLVDVHALEAAGIRVEDAFPRAQAKDAGLTAAQLAWVLSEVSIGEDASIPGGVSPRELDDYLGELRERLVRLGFPGKP